MTTRREALRALVLPAAAGAGISWMPDRLKAETPSAGGPCTLPPLPYAFDALEPHIDAMTMQTHHGKHHAAYVNNLNNALAAHPDLLKRPAEDLVRNLASLPESVRAAVRNNGGGHVNHSLFWQGLSPRGGRPKGDLAKALDKRFGSFDAFKEQLTKAALGVFGSGWAWLSLDNKKQLLIESTPNQDSPLTTGHVPLVAIDVWEHAYYLKYQNRRADYVAAFFNVVNWDFVSDRYRRLAG